MRSAMRYPLVPLVLLLTLGQAVPLAAEPFLVRDSAPGRETFPSSLPLWDGVADDEGIVYFLAADPAHWNELWRSDGTPAGTYRLTDVCPGPCSASPSVMTVFGDEIFFIANDGVSGAELWATGRAPGSTRRVRDLCPGLCGGLFSAFTQAAGRLFFLVGNDGGQALWTTDGSRQGTVPIASIPGFLRSLPQRVGDRVVFQVGDEIWRSDGTPAGTGPLLAANGAPPPATPPFSTGEVAYFWTADALWVTDGTGPGTRQLRTVAELGATPEAWQASQGGVWRGDFYAVLEDGSLLRSDGTPEGTRRIAQVPGTFGGSTELLPLADALLIVYRDSGRIWRTEGTLETTREVADLTGSIEDVGVLGDHLVFRRLLPGGEVVMQLWVSDGTPAGTRRLEGIDPGPPDSRFITAGSQLFYGNNAQLWRTDGSEAGTTEVHDFADVPAAGGPLEQAGLRGKLLFLGRIAPTQVTLFSSDGTRAGTRAVRDFDGVRGLFRFGGEVFFEAWEQDDVQSYPRPLGLWKTDGTSRGMVRVGPRIEWFSSPMPLGRTLLFSAKLGGSYFGNADVELYRTDGTPGSAGLLKNLDPFYAETGLHHTCYGEPSAPGPGIEIGGRLLFAANDGRHGRELFVSDGTEDGTRLLLDIDPRRLNEPPAPDCDNRRRTGVGSDPADFVRLGSGVLFTAADGEAGRELWWTDGTAAGTRRVADLRPGAEGSAPHDLVVHRGMVWFIAATEGVGEALWRSDGTARGTVLVHSLTVRGHPSWARDLTVAGGRLFFVLSNELAGPELWVTRGPTAATRRVADIHPGPDGSYPQSLTAVGSLLVFAADDGVHGLEPWKSDGTAAGTVPLGDIHPGFGASAPGPFTPVAGGRVLTGADDGTHGRELWSILIEE